MPPHAVSWPPTAASDDDGGRIRVEGVSRRFCLSASRARRYALGEMARQFLPRTAAEEALRPGEFWALRDVFFGVGKGEALGVMGRNGAGKSTLLRILLGTIRPTSGMALLRGRVTALSLDVGLDPTLTGRENALVIGALHGIERRQLQDGLDEIAAFSELGEFFDVPVDCYSSGMRARLGFATAMQIDPEILLIDEALAVGDAGFQGRCVERIRRYVERGGTLVLVSHSTYHVATTCSRVLLLEGGRVVFDGDAREGVARYLQAVDPEAQDAGLTRRSSAPARPAQHGEPEPVTILGLDIESLTAALTTGQPARVRMRYRVDSRLEAAWCFEFVSPRLEVGATGAAYGLEGGFHLEPGSREVSCTIPSLPLRAGPWALRGGILDRNRWPLARVGFDEPPVPFVVAPSARRSDELFDLASHLLALDGVVFENGSDAAR